MTDIVEKITKCGVCGKGNQVSVMLSCSHFGSCDLDTRPPALFPFTIFLQHCRHCGYVNTDISEGNSSMMDFIQSEMYQTCDGINPESPDARDYIRYAIMQSYMKVHEGLFDFINSDFECSQENIFWGFLNAAWACDDAAMHEPEEDEEQYDRELCRRNAIECRKRCLDLVNSLIVSQEDQEERETLSGIKADLLRRTGQFDAVIAEYENKVFHNPYVDQVIRFEMDLAKAKDTKSYSMDQIDPIKYPLKIDVQP